MGVTEEMVVDNKISYEDKAIIKIVKIVVIIIIGGRVAARMLGVGRVVVIIVVIRGR